MRRYLNQFEAEAALETYFPDFINAIHCAMDEVISIRRFTADSGSTITYEPRTIATMLHDHAKAHLTNTFSTKNYSEVKVDTVKKIFYLSIDGVAVLRLKKLKKKDLSPSNIPTKQAVMYDRQHNIFDLSGSPTNLYLGYTLDKASYNVTGIYVVMRIGKELQWSIDLLNNTSEGLGTIPFVTDPNPVVAPAAQVRVTVKETSADVNRRVTVKKSS